MSWPTPRHPLARTSRNLTRTRQDTNVAAAMSSTASQRAEPIWLINSNIPEYQ